MNSKNQRKDQSDNYRKTQIDGMEILGKIPPQAVDLEEVVLGAMLFDKRCIDPVLGLLKAENFYKEEHQKIFSAIAEMRNNGKTIDLLTVTEQLRMKGDLDAVGGPVYVTGLTGKINSGFHAEKHAVIVKEKFLLREMIRIASEIESMAFADEMTSDEIAQFFQENIDQAVSEGQVECIETMGQALKRRIEEIEAVQRNKDQLLGLPSGLTKLDRSTGGWQKQDLIIIAARPSIGKTAFALWSGLETAFFNHKVAIFSLEMSKGQLVDRALSSQTAMSPLSIRSGRVEWQQLEPGIAKLNNISLFIDDTPALSIPQLRAKALKLKTKYHIEMIVIDYLQLMNGGGRNREQEISSISRGLKTIAKELNIPVIALSQLNRDAEGKRPVLSNLRESGAIEQDADLVIFIHRPEKYGVDRTEEGIPTKGLVELIVEKHRNGPCGLINCYTNEFVTKFADFEDDLIEKVSEFKTQPLKNLYEPDKGDNDNLPF